MNNPKNEDDQQTVPCCNHNSQSVHQKELFYLYTSP